MNWFSRLGSRRKPSVPRTRLRSAKPTPRARLLVEWLEERTLMNTDFALGGAFGLGGNEPQIAVNPLNPSNVVAVQNNQLQISTDSGGTFLPSSISAPRPAGADPISGVPYATYGTGGDDVLAFDAQGRLFWVYLLALDANGDGMLNNPGAGDDISVIVAQVDPLTGATIRATDVTAGNSIEDKPWIAADADPASPFANNLYVVWSHFGGVFGGAPTAIQFSRSLNQGFSWSPPKDISGGTAFSWPPTVTVAPNGDVYATWAFHFLDIPPFTERDGVRVLRSGTGGADWAAGVRADESTPFHAGEADIRDNNNLGRIANSLFWTQGAFTPYVLADPIRPGNVYVVANDDPDDHGGMADDGDVVLARSTDYGQHWERTTISHGPLGSLQVFPTAAIDQNGNIAVMWYDTRRQLTNANANFLLDIYATASKDGGITFSNDFRINDLAFDPEAGAGAAPFTSTPQIVRIGEYNGLAASNGVAYADWTGNSFTGATPSGQQVFFDKFSILGAFPDRFEPNEASVIGIATDLGAAPTYNENSLTISSSTDEDVFKIVALATGKLDVQIEYAGSVSDLDVEVQNNAGVPIRTATAALDGNNVENLTIPAVKGQIYFVRVFAQPGQQSPISTYTLSVVNTPLPVVCGVDLEAGSDSGRSDNDNVTNRSFVTFDITCPGLAQFLPQGQGLDVDVFNGDVQIGTATFVSGSTWRINTGALHEGHDNFISAAAVTVDAASSVFGRGDHSPWLQVTLDTTPPPAPTLAIDPAGTPGAVVGTDGTVSVTDTTPGFVGQAEADDIVRLTLNAVADGLTVAVPLDGDEPFAGGQWNLTGTLDLMDPRFSMTGTRRIAATAEDLAGNFSTATALTVAVDAGAMSRLVNARFIDRVFRDVLGRPPDAMGAAFWVGLLEHGVSRDLVVRTIENSDEYRSNTVQLLYTSLLGRPADRGGVDFFVRFLATGGTPEQIKVILIGSGEYFTRSGGTNAGFLNALFRDVLSRPLDPGGEAFFTFQLTHGVPASNVALQVVSSLEAANVLTDSFYQRFLHRAADRDGLNFFANGLLHGLRDEEVISSLTGSDEYLRSL